MRGNGRGNLGTDLGQLKCREDKLLRHVIVNSRAIRLRSRSCASSIFVLLSRSALAGSLTRSTLAGSNINGTAITELYI